jgi:predicted transcriptional regulator
MGKIVIKSVERPREETPDAIIKWFCKVFDLDSEIETELMKRFINAAKQNKPITSSELTFRSVARSTVIYHLNRFIDAGLIVRKGRKYLFRGSNLSSLIEEMEYDINREIQRMLDLAREFDSKASKKFK